ncbi:class 3 adenylate cyclase/tetratricopeptide (TPR) repeat protein [Longispora fulva]|uniref:Class 3 adenylate cyclase/tetratricopeptide (TPR) repeat protein n=2 Tax=Longispora fulva TaxID=619741 RepID=A0A8J7GGW2_9ACTN|nr:class 3 adenylate cyclase/tetratricopeptide (TPR) repeat protein [Longispora fulva]
MRRRVSSRRRFHLDEEATARIIAELGLRMPVLKPAPDRWLDVSLIVDATGEVDLWAGLTRELHVLLQRLGAFRDVRAWYLHRTDHESFGLTSGRLLTRPRSPAELLDPQGRRIYLVVSDCVGSQWQSEPFRRLIRKWASSGPLAVLQPLPERLWSRTSLPPTQGRLHAPAPGAPNVALRFNDSRSWNIPDHEDVPVPVVALTAEWLAPWASLVSGLHPGGIESAFHILGGPPVPPLTSPTFDHIDPRRRVEEFFAGASPEAYTLARYLGAAPLSLPVMRIVQRAMLPRSGPEHLAEVLFSGLLVPLRVTGTGEPFYDFHDGVRDVLLGTLRQTEAVQVLAETSEYVDSNLDLPGDRFAVAVPDPEGQLVLPVEAQVFAQLRAHVLNRFTARTRWLEAVEPPTVTPRPKSRSCTKCGRRCAEDDRFCGGCGTSLSLSCAKCGRVLPAEATFCTGCGTPTSDDDVPQAAHEDRRRVSVLFMDLIDSTRYAERVDSGQVRAMQHGFFGTARRVIRQHGGVVEKYIGDAVMAVFGAPVATETDPLRCVRAGLELQRALMKEAPDSGLRFRVGIVTGDALVDVAAARDGGQAIVAGEVVNTAARLQTSAPPGGVLVDRMTYLATRDAVRYSEQPPLHLRGRPIATEVWLAEAPVRRRPPDEVDHTPLIGRERELNLLTDALHQSFSGRVPQLVTVLGRAGIGKTRLVRELYTKAEHITGGPVAWRTGYCPPFGEDVTFIALADIVRAHTGILDTDGAETARKRLATTLHEAGAESDGRLADALAPLVGLSGSKLSAEDASSLWRRYLRSMAAQRPTVLLFEDIHLADPALLSFIELLVGGARDLPLLVLCTGRQELLEREPSWAGAVAGSLTITLPPMRDTDIAAVYAQMFGQTSLPAETLAPLVEFAGGNPLYAHEYARMLIERGTLRRGERSWSLRGDDDLPMPDSVHAVIANRIDLLDAADRTVLQAAAVVGATFWPGAVAAAVGRSVEAIERALRRLEQRDLVSEQHESTMAGQVEYRFRHVLVREVCYQRLPRTERIARHERTATWLSGVSDSRADDLAEVTARHRSAAYEIALSLGLETERYARTARQALHAAARRAYRLYALDRATTYAERALQLCPADEPDLATGRLQLELLVTELAYYRDRDSFLRSGGVDQLVTLGERLHAIGDLAGAAQAATLSGTVAIMIADRIAALGWLERALDLFAQLPDSIEKATAHTELSRLHMLNYEHDPAATSAAQALDIADRLNLVEIRASAMITMGTARVLAGDPTGRQDLDDAFAYCRGRELPATRRVAINISWAMQEDGDMAGSRLLIDQYLNSDVTSRHGTVADFSEEAMWSFFAGDWLRLLSAADAFLDTPSGEWDLQNRMIRAWIRELCHVRGEDDLTRTVTMARQTGFHRPLWVSLGHGAFCRALQGRFGESEELLRELVEDWVPTRTIASREWVAAAAFAAALTGSASANRLHAVLEDSPRLTPWVTAALHVTSTGSTAARPQRAGDVRFRTAEGHRQVGSLYAKAAELYRQIGDITDWAIATALAARAYEAAGDPAARPLIAETRTFADRNSAPGLTTIGSTVARSSTSGLRMPRNDVG